MSTASGSCLCGAVRYTLADVPVTSVLCHCTNCQKSSGSTFQANNFYKQQALTILSGKDKLSSYLDTNTESGGTPTRFFCSICGSNIMTTNEGNPFVKGHVIIMSGCLDGTNDTDTHTVDFKPKQEFFCKDKANWYQVVEKTQEFQGMT